MVKTCETCGKDITGTHANRKFCSRKCAYYSPRTQAQTKAYLARPETKALNNQRQTAWRKSNPEATRAAGRKFDAKRRMGGGRATNPAYAAAYRNRYLIRTYGITEADYQEMLDKQGGVCIICGRKAGKVRLAVDHDHTTNRIRGLIHSRENHNLGAFEYSVKVLEGLREYISAIIEDRKKFEKENNK